MKYLVTGVSGFIGSTLAEKILGSDSDAQIVGIDSFTDYYDPSIKRNNIRSLADDRRLSMIEKDINDIDIDELLDSVDVVFHQAGQPGVRKSWGTSFDVYLQQNIAATQRLLEGARRSTNLLRFVYASSSSVYGNAEKFPTSETDVPRPFSPYGVTKLAAEHLCSLYGENYGVPTVSLRYFTVYGPRQRPDMGMHKFITQALRGESLSVFGDGTQIRDFTYVDDIVEGNLLAARADLQPGEVLNLCGGSTVSVNEVIAYIEEGVGATIKVEHLAKVAGDVFQTGGTNERARDRLGWQPQVRVREGVLNQIQQLREAQIVTP